MREIKFRAWHYEDGNPLYEGYMDNYSKLSSFFKSVEDEPYSVEVMQYTGLKDKNLEKQNEVYESDIIEFINGNKAVVEWDNYTGGWIARSIHKPMMKWNLVDSLLESALVIGNIYENKDLLN